MAYEVGWIYKIMMIFYKFNLLSKKFKNLSWVLVYILFIFLWFSRKICMIVSTNPPEEEGCDKSKFEVSNDDEDQDDNNDDDGGDDDGDEDDDDNNDVDDDDGDKDDDDDD